MKVWLEGNMHTSYMAGLCVCEREKNKPNITCLETDSLTPPRSPAGALLQEYLDQLEPEEALGEEEEEVEEELMFAG